MANFISLNYDASQAIKALDVFADEMDEEFTRPVAQAGAEYMVHEVRAKVRSLGRKTGLLLGSIYQAYGKEISKNGYSEYGVSWRVKKTSLPRAPHGHFLEFGYSQPYVVFVARKGRYAGQFFTAKNRDKYGEAKPSRAKSDRAKREAMYLRRHNGPKRIPAHPFLVPTYESHKSRVMAHMLRKGELVLKDIIVRRYQA